MTSLCAYNSRSIEKVGNGLGTWLLLFLFLIERREGGIWHLWQRNLDLWWEWDLKPIIWFMPAISKRLFFFNFPRGRPLKTVWKETQPLHVSVVSFLLCGFWLFSYIHAFRPYYFSLKMEIKVAAYLVSAYEYISLSAGSIRWTKLK